MLNLACAPLHLAYPGLRGFVVGCTHPLCLNFINDIKIIIFVVGLAGQTLAQATAFCINGKGKGR